MSVFVAAGGATLAGLIVLGCSSDEPSRPTPERSAAREEARAPVEPEGCPTRARYLDRWPDLASGGPSIGPITLAIGEAAHTSGLPAQREGSAWLRAKLLLLIDAEAGTRLRVDARAVSKNGSLRLSHFSTSGSPSRAQQPIATKVPDRGQREGRPADIPGFIYASRPGCYELRFTLGSDSFGPFGLTIVED